MSAAIEVRQLTKKYGATTAVQNLSFEVFPGRVTGFLGPNGAGKSTTMRAIVGLDRPTSGEVLIGGERYDRLTRPLRHVGTLLDEVSAHRGRTVRAHLDGLARSNRIDRSRVGEVLDAVGLTPVADRRAKGLSLGMCRRLGVATALLGDPPVLLLDEPVNGLDPEGIRWIRALMRRLAAEGRTVFVSSHLMSEMALTADHLIVIGQGRLLADSSAEEFISRNSRSFILIRTPEPERARDVLAAAGIGIETAPDGALEAVGTTLEDVGALIARNQIVVYEISPRSASLEEAFMRLTADAVDHRAKQEV
jgi:ABC-2 type transport system ATP-binding protein